MRQVSEVALHVAGLQGKDASNNNSLPSPPCFAQDRFC